MLLYVFFHTYPKIEMPDYIPWEAIVSSMVVCCHQYVVYQGFWYYNGFKFITCGFHNLSSENAILNEVNIGWQATYLKPLQDVVYLGIFGL